MNEGTVGTTPHISLKIPEYSSRNFRKFQGCSEWMLTYPSKQKYVHN